MDRPPIELPPEPGDGLVEHLVSLVDHHHVLAHLFRVGHDVRGQQHRRAAPMLAHDVLAQQADADRILAAERLVENEQIGLVNDRGDELHALEHALRQILAGLVLRLRADPCSRASSARRAAAASRRMPFSCAM